MSLSPLPVDSAVRGRAAGLRVLLLNYEYPPLGGGAGIATAALAERLAEWGASVDVVTSAVGTASTHERVGRGLVVHRMAIGRTRLHQAGMGDAARYLVAALPTVRRLVRRNRYDVVHCFFGLPTGALLPLAGLGDVPTVVSLRGSDVPGYDPCAVTLQRVHRVLKPLTRRLWRGAGKVVALSESLGRLAAETDPALDYAVIRNGVDVRRFRPPATPRPLRIDRVRCLAVARLVERKGLVDLLEALASLERGRFELEIVGDGADAGLLRVRTRELGLEDEVRFLGALDHDAVAERYRAADLFTLPSWEESFGCVFAEALASGLPIVGTQVGGIPEFVTHGRNGLLVPPRRPDLVAEAIRQLADRPLVRDAMRRRNRAKAESVLTWEANAARYLELYTRLVGPRRVPAERPVRRSAPLWGRASGARRWAGGE